MKREPNNQASSSLLTLELHAHPYHHKLGPECVFLSIFTRVDFRTGLSEGISSILSKMPELLSHSIARDNGDGKHKKLHLEMFQSKENHAKLLLWKIK